MFPKTIRLPLLASASDIQGDAFSFAIDSAYKFLTEVPYTEPDPLKNTEICTNPDYNSAGQHDFTYTGSDSYGNVSTGKVTVNVKNVNRMPVALPIDTLSLHPMAITWFWVLTMYLPILIMICHTRSRIAKQRTAESVCFGQ
ncbi:MAG: hypothetical protein U0Z17_00895 [Bacteroidales bacterium]